MKLDELNIEYIKSIEYDSIKIKPEDYVVEIDTKKSVDINVVLDAVINNIWNKNTIIDKYKMLDNIVDSLMELSTKCEDYESKKEQIQKSVKGFIKNSITFSYDKNYVKVMSDKSKVIIVYPKYNNPLIYVI
ncbi:MAG: hypothetical protein ACRC92_20350 [Peptostreptococcaceae bacterium]